MLDLEPIKERLLALSSHGPAVYVSARNEFNQHAVDDVAALIEEVDALQSRARCLETALNDQIELWEMAKPTLDLADARQHRVKFMEIYDPIKAIQAALEHSQDHLLR